jgi:hypothetical protein
MKGVIQLGRNAEDHQTGGGMHWIRAKDSDGDLWVGLSLEQWEEIDRRADGVLDVAVQDVVELMTTVPMFPWELGARRWVVLQR